MTYTIEDFLKRIASFADGAEAKVKNLILDATLTFWFKNNPTVTSLEFKNFLREKHPTLSWKQEEVSNFLSSTNHPFTDNGTYRTYYKDNIPAEALEIKEVTADVIEDLAGDRKITKRTLKTELSHADYSLANFDQAFEESRLKHTGDYTGDNKKIYKLVLDGTHLSKAKGDLIAIKDMPLPYLKNAIVKIAQTSKLNLKEVLEDSTCEEYQLMEAYFTHNLRRKIQAL